MSESDSRALIRAVDADQVDREEIRDILYRYFEQNTSAIWRDALVEHELIRAE